jgi:hypothetical protein
MNDIAGFYNVAVHPGQISIYYESMTPRRPVMKPYIDSDETDVIVSRVPAQFKDNSHHGVISAIARRKITRAINYLVYLVPKKKYYHPGTGKTRNFFLNFITLTLSSEQIHTDNEIKSLILQPFLNELRKKRKVINYFWRAEKQENGSIHFHLITDRFVWWNDLRNMWNFYQQKLGYVTRYRNNQVLWHRSGFTFRPELAPRWTMAAQLRAYKDGIRTDWHSPNSTDVHGLSQVGNVRSYLLKYIEKSEQSAEVQGRLWGCSSGLADLKGARAIAAGAIADELDILAVSKSIKLFKSEYFSVMYFDPKLLATLHLVLLISLFNEYLIATFPHYRPPELFP